MIIKVANVLYELFLLHLSFLFSYFIHYGVKQKLNFFFKWFLFDIANRLPKIYKLLRTLTEYAMWHGIYEI